MSIKFACECGKAYKVPEKFAGKRVRCKNCGETVAVPSASAPISSARAAAVSNRSMMKSGRQAEHDDADDADDDDAPAPKSQSARLSDAAKSHRAPAMPTRRPGGDTQRVEVADIMSELKRYQKKRDDETLAAGVGKLTLFKDGKAAQAFRIEKTERTIGRGDRCEIKIDVKSVSKEHAKIEYKLGHYIATDMRSLNGMLVNGKTVRRASLRDGDLVQLGDAILRFEVGGTASSS